MKAIVIKSKGLEKTGFEREWELVEEFDTKGEAKDFMIETSLSMEGASKRGDRAYDDEKDEFIFTNDDDEFRYNDYIYRIVTIRDIKAGIFKGDMYGYTPSFIEKVFSIEKL